MLQAFFEEGGGEGVLCELECSVNWNARQTCYHLDQAVARAYARLYNIQHR